MNDRQRKKGMDEKLVSIIITTYKRNIRILERAVKSALNQSYKNKEIIIINDYPPYKDKIENLKYKYSQIAIFHNEQNCGACRSRNRGARLSHGEYLAFLDDDDEWDSKKIEKQTIAAEEEKAGLVYCEGKSIYSDGREESLSFIEDCRDEPVMAILRKNCFGGCSFPLISAQAFGDVGGFDPDFRSSQDHDLWIRICQKYKVGFVPEPLVKYYITKTSITSNVENRIQGYQLILEKHVDILKKYPKSAADLYYQYFEVLLKAGSIRGACYFLLRSFSVFPYNMKILPHFIERIFYKMNKERKL